MVYMIFFEVNALIGPLHGGNIGPCWKYLCLLYRGSIVKSSDLRGLEISVLVGSTCLLYRGSTVKCSVISKVLLAKITLSTRATM